MAKPLIFSYSINTPMFKYSMQNTYTGDGILQHIQDHHNHQDWNLFSKDCSCIAHQYLNTCGHHVVTSWTQLSWICNGFRGSHKSILSSFYSIPCLFYALWYDIDHFLSQRKHHTFMHTGGQNSQPVLPLKVEMYSVVQRSEFKRIRSVTWCFFQTIG